MEEKIFELRKVIINTLRGMPEEVKISLKKMNPKFDDNIIQLILFNSGELKGHGLFFRNSVSIGPEWDQFFGEMFSKNIEKRNELFSIVKTDKKDNKNPTREDFIEELITCFKNAPLDFCYFKAPKIIEMSNTDKKPSDFLFYFKSLCINEDGTFSPSKEFALPKDVLKKIDFTDVSFNRFNAECYDFTGLHGVRINPQTIRNLGGTVLNGVEFIGPFDHCYIKGANFTGSKNAIINSNTLPRRMEFYDCKAEYNLELSGCVFNSVTFTGVIGAKPCDYLTLTGADFTGSNNAIINLKKCNYIMNCNFKDAYIIGKIKKDASINGTKFRGLMGKKHGVFESNTPIDIYINNLNNNFENTDFGGCRIIGKIVKGNIKGANFEDSTGAVIILGKVQYDNNTNFKDAIVYDQKGNRINVTVDGRLSYSVSEKIDEIFGMPNREIVSQKAKEDAINESLVAKRKNTLEIIKTKLEILKNTEQLSEIEMKDLYGKIPIDKDTLLVDVGDHFEINRFFIPYLRFLNLISIDFGNVNIKGLDLRKTNAFIDPQKVYNKDISYCNLDDTNISFSTDLTGVNIEGTVFDECSDLFKTCHKEEIQIISI